MSATERSIEVRQGLDLSKFQQSVNTQGANPDEVRFILEAEGAWEGRVSHTRTVQRSAVFNLPTLGHANAPVVEVAS